MVPGGGSVLCMRYSLSFGFRSCVYSIFSVRDSFIFFFSVAVFDTLLLIHYVVVTGIIATLLMIHYVV